MMQNLLLLDIAEADILQLHTGIVLDKACFLICLPPFRLREKFINPVNTGNRRLNRLNLHTDALQRTENLRNIGNHSHCHTDGHAEEVLYHRITRCRQCQYHRRYKRVENQYHRRVNRIIEICFFHGVIALAYVIAVPPLHVILFLKGMDRADVANGLRHMIRHLRHRLPVFDLRNQRPLLDNSRKGKDQRSNQEQYQCKTRLLPANDHKNADHLA